MNLTEKLRLRIWHALNPAIAATAGLTVRDLQQFIARVKVLTPEQERQLCLTLGVK